MTLSPDTPLFDLPLMLKRVFPADLKAAGIPKRDANGRVVDVHSLRHTFGTMLARAGVGLVQAQRLMRHSDPKLTASVYTHLDVLDGGAAVDRLPTLPAVDPLPLLLVLATGKTCQNESISGNSEGQKQYSRRKRQTSVLTNKDGACQDVARGSNWWAVQDSNLRPFACKADALTN